MQFDFFPSRTLTYYLARLFIARIAAVLVMLVLVLQLLDLLTETAKILDHSGNGEAQIWMYVSLRLPQLVQQFTPYAVLLATMFTFFPLNQNSEIVAMRAAGLSAHQLLAPMLATALVVSGLSFAFNELVVTHDTARLKAWQDASYGPIPEDVDVRTNVFATSGANILFAETVTGTGTAMHMYDVTWYLRDAQGMLVSQIRSPQARYAAPGWRLDAPVAFTVATTATQKLPPTIIGRSITANAVEISNVNPDGVNIIALTRSIRALRAAGRPVAELEGAWWHKISKPLSAVLMPLLGALAAFGLARSGQLLIRSVIGTLLGFAYFVVDNASLAMGNMGAYPPLIAAWAPFFLFLAIGETVLFRNEE